MSDWLATTPALPTALRCCWVDNQLANCNGCTHVQSAIPSGLTETSEKHRYMTVTVAGAPLQGDQSCQEKKKNKPMQSASLTGEIKPPSGKPGSRGKDAGGKQAATGPDQYLQNEEKISLEKKAQVVNKPPQGLTNICRMKRKSPLKRKRRW